MALWQHKGNWFIDYRFPPGAKGKRVQEKIGPHKKDATVRLGQIEQAIREGRNPMLARIAPAPFEYVAKEFMEKYVKPQRRDVKTFKYSLRLLSEYFKGKTLQQITPRMVDDFVASRIEQDGVQPGTTNRQRAHLQKLFNWARKKTDYYRGENPVEAVERQDEAPGRIRFLTPAEADALVAAAPDHLRPIILCALHTGGRRGEVLALKWEHIDLENRVVTFVRENTKSGKQREIPINDVLLAVLKERRKVMHIGGYVFTRRGKRLHDVRTAFETAREDAGLKKGDVVFHSLRHTFASWFMINGGDIYRLQKFMGHSTLALTQRYAHLSPKFLRDGVQYIGAPPASTGDRLETSAGSGATKSAGQRPPEDRASH